MRLQILTEYDADESFTYKKDNRCLKYQYNILITVSTIK